MTNTTSTTNNPQNRMNTTAAARRYYWNGTESVPMPKQTLSEKIAGAVLMASVILGFLVAGIAYAKTISHHDAKAAAAYSHR
jgi:hypothetical protein